MRLRSTIGGLCAASACFVAAADARDLEIPPDSTDAIALARAAEEAGDAQLERALRASEDRLAVLVAIRASAFARAPERLVPLLAGFACGRDPALAPEAAHTLARIAERLTPAALAAREVLKSELASARAALACTELPTPRADIAAALAALAAVLAALD